MRPSLLTLAVFATTLLLSGGAQAKAPNASLKVASLKVERTVLVMRHGVRPPTKAPAMPQGVAAQAWPDWPVAPGWLTPHGGLAVERLGTADALRFRAQGLLPRHGCPSAAAVRIVADSDQRTIETARHWTRALAPACALAIDHKPQDENDPRFDPLRSGLAKLDPAQAMAAVEAATGPDGMAALDRANRPLLTRLDAILCGPATSACGVSTNPSVLVSGKAGGRPKMSGALDQASTAAQVLLLEYGEGKPLSEVGWGRASAADIAALSAFHALEFRLLARPPVIAAASLAGLTPVIREGLSGSAKVTLIAGHDTNVANLAGLLDAHWHVPGFAADDPAPGGAIVLELLRDADGTRFVRAAYRAQTLDQIRTAAPLAKAWRTPLTIGRCTTRIAPDTCPLDDFLKLLENLS
ncbi:phosphoanhydride phosphohydrolase / 4-phytase multifunctional enzyme [Novosphingobium nitrogenifigens DSM 19370]|uniref:Phosphoanhydride phosphohydrolase / 4-phytase multifunctional enzyme n=2 Tax=Novosphingobium nitrogenifigens TaxID=378548 RepID=F1Z9L7_9SPHN|nr:phosphoanhydride phosphohydrolase / 4-phytase multifunctional enzyme [Novosphingobium nitrogenifigens DSM 19370]